MRPFAATPDTLKRSSTTSGHLAGAMLAGFLAAQALSAATCPNTSCNAQLPPLPGSAPDQCGPYINGLPPTPEGPSYDGDHIMGVSYFSAIGAPISDVESDLDWLGNRGFDHLRIMATWNRDWIDGNPGGNLPVPNACIIDAGGNLIPDRVNALRAILDAATERGFTVDVSFWYRDYLDQGCELQSCGDDDSCWPRYQNGVVDFVEDIEGEYPNVFIDVDNESYAGPGSPHWDKIEGLKLAAAAADANRLLTFSQGGLNQNTSAGQLGYNIVQGGADLAAPHFQRTENWDDDTVLRVDHLRDILDTIIPIHLQEEARVGWCDGGAGGSSENCQHDDILNSLGLSIYAGAAGWNFHTSAGFDLPGTRFRTRLGGSSAEECKAALCAGDARQAALDQQAEAGCVPGGLAPVYSDNFNDAEDGAQLQGRALQVGSAVWDTIDPGWQLKTVEVRGTSGLKVTTAYPNGTATGGIPYNLPGDFDGVASIEAELTRGVHATSVSIGFASSPDSPLAQDGVFWVSLADGDIYLYGAGSVVLGSIHPLMEIRKSTLKLEYDGGASELRLFSRGGFLGGWTQLLAVPVFPANIDYAVLEIDHGRNGEDFVDDFAVRMNP